VVARDSDGGAQAQAREAALLAAADEAERRARTAGQRAREARAAAERAAAERDAAREDTSHELEGARASAATAARDAERWRHRTLPLSRARRGEARSRC
jgi:hypothetical protein